jgi:hypothetical protein
LTALVAKTVGLRKMNYLKQTQMELSINQHP